jgi:RNA polymerase sigma-70 factor (ECF subfamily)
LKPHYRELLILREYEQLSYMEIARITGLTESAVKSGLFKPRKALGKKLESILNERSRQ